MYGVPQGSILGPLLFNIFLNDLFMFLPNHDIISYADDNTAFCAGKQSTEVLSCLEKISKILLDWFENNCMKANPDKCNFMISSTGVSEITVGNTQIQNSESEKLFGVRKDKRLKFDEHVKSLVTTLAKKSTLFLELHLF